MRRIAVFAVSGLLVLGVLGPASAAPAKSGDELKTGGCSGAAMWKLKLSVENGKIEVEFEVDANRAGQDWRVKLFHDGVRFFNQIRTTKAPSGSFTVRRLVANHGGDDVIKGRARSLGSGQLCVGKATFTA